MPDYNVVINSSRTWVDRRKILHWSRLYLVSPSFFDYFFWVVQTGGQWQHNFINTQNWNHNRNTNTWDLHCSTPKLLMQMLSLNHVRYLEYVRFVKCLWCAKIIFGHFIEYKCNLDEYEQWNRFSRLRLFVCTFFIAISK